MAFLTVVISFIVFALATAAGFVYMPKGPDILVWRTCLVLSVVSCWIMWAVTYMAQLNPLIKPERTFGHLPSNGSGGH
ncbi:ATP synthase subunit H-domain-containing protein [Entophlyctis helioformis]|nr:ATP synthase subunit H-domain-containing protein [Entophlyctis helioformis]